MDDSRLFCPSCGAAIRIPVDPIPGGLFQCPKCSGHFTFNLHLKPIAAQKQTARVLDRADMDALVLAHGGPKVAIGCKKCKGRSVVLEYEIGSGAILCTCPACHGFVVAVRVASRTQGRDRGEITPPPTDRIGGPAK